MEASLGIHPTASMVPVRRRDARGRRRPPRHVPHARIRPRRVPPGDRRGFRRRTNPRRNRIVFHPNPRGRREAPRAAHRPCRLPHPSRDLRHALPTRATVAEKPLARHGILHAQLRGNRPARDPPALGCGLPWFEHGGRCWIHGVQSTHRVLALRRDPGPRPRRRGRGVPGGIQPEPAAVHRRDDRSNRACWPDHLRARQSHREEGAARLRVDRRDAVERTDSYVVTKNVIDPTVDAAGWVLSIGGLVSNPTTYSYPDLQALASVDEFVTLECVSNEVGGNLISTAEWTGVRLATILQSAGVDLSPGNWILFNCADGYTAGIPIAKAMDPNTLAAVYMTGGPLATAHGYPARIIVPGLYGMFHAKWLTKIEAVQGLFSGYWQQKGWTNSDDPNGRIHTVAIIAWPADNSVVGGSTEIGIVAFAGDRGISLVEVSTDGGSTWNAATPLKVPLSGLTWSLWKYTPTGPLSGGSHRIVARAYDGTGLIQDSVPEPPFPSGAKGYDSITLLVSQ